MKLKDIHTVEELEAELGEIPICACGCGEKIKVTLSIRSIKAYHWIGYPKYTNGHACVGKKMSDQAKEKLSLSQKERLKKGNPIIGTHHTEATKIKISQARKGKYVGEKSSRFGKHLSKETKNKLRIANIGKQHTKEAKEKMSQSRKGHIFSKEHNDKISQAMSGENHYNYGKHLSEEHKAKLSNALKGDKSPVYGIPLSDETKRKLSEAHKGVYPSEETRKKLSESKKGSKNINYGKLPPMNGTYAKGSWYESPFQGKVWLRSTWELAYVKYLDELKEPWFYEMETFILTDTTYTPDFFLPRQNKFIEIKGIMHDHSMKKIQAFQEEYPFDLQVLYRNDLQALGIKL